MAPFATGSLEIFLMTSLPYAFFYLELKVTGGWVRRACLELDKTLRAFRIVLDFFISRIRLCEWQFINYLKSFLS